MRVLNLSHPHQTAKVKRWFSLICDSEIRFCNQSRLDIISSDGVMISIAPTTCSRSYRTAQVSWHRRFSKSCTAPRATPCHENHACCCILVSLCGSDSIFTFLLKELTPPTVWCFGQKHLKPILKLFVVLIAFQPPNPFNPFSRNSKSRSFVPICGSDCVSATKHGEHDQTQKPFVPFPRS